MKEGRDYHIGFAPEIAADPRIGQFYAYWTALRGARPFPAKTEVDVAAIPKLAGCLILLKVFQDPLDFEYRIIGEDIAVRLSNLKGQRVRDGALMNVGASAYLNYCAVVESGRPQFMDGWTVLPNRSHQPVRLSRVHCPLSDDGKTVDHIISCIAFAN